MLDQDTKTKLLNLLENSKSILVTSHISPDLDAICSATFTLKILKTNYPDKKIYGNIENCELYYDFLPDTKEVTNLNTIEYINSVKPDLIIIVDGPTITRAVDISVRKEFLELISNSKINTIVIDHHEKQALFENEPEPIVTINEHRSSACEQLYVTFVENLNFKIYSDYNIYLLTGVLTDTNRFMYLKPNSFKETFRIAQILIEQGASIEFIDQNITKKTYEDTRITNELLTNLKCENKFNYTYISESFYKEKVEGKILSNIFSKVIRLFCDEYLPKTANNKWGFCVRPSEIADNYDMSFRAVNGVIDTTVFTKQLGGGGHKGASGGTIKANSLQEAIDKLKSVIETHMDEAIKNA